MRRDFEQQCIAYRTSADWRMGFTLVEAVLGLAILLLLSVFAVGIAYIVVHFLSRVW